MWRPVRDPIHCVRSISPEGGISARAVHKLATRTLKSMCARGMGIVPGRSVSSTRRGRIVCADPITHRAIAALALVPHPTHGGVAGVYIVVDAHIGLGGVCAVQAPGVLLKCALPRDGHREHQGIERRAIETLPDETAGREQRSRRFAGQSVQRFEQVRAFFPAYSTMQHEQALDPSGKNRGERLKLIRALGQNEYAASVLAGGDDIGSDALVAPGIRGQMPEDYLNPGVGRYVEWSVEKARQHRKLLWCSFGA